MHLVLLEITRNTHLKPHGQISSSEKVGITVGQLSKYLVQTGPFTFYLCLAEGYAVAPLQGGISGAHSCLTQPHPPCPVFSELPNLGLVVVGVAAAGSRGITVTFFSFFSHGGMSLRFPFRKKPLERSV